MTKENDYRNTEYCPVLDKVEEQKMALEEEIIAAFPKTKIMYNKVRERGSCYHKKFAKIYNEKCAYCGARWGLLPVESFEIDHFINEASFDKTTEGKIQAGRMHNLAWACISCNRGKSGITIMPPYDKLLNVDNGNIAFVFKRDENFYIQICDGYKSDEFIKQFYKALHLDYETRRLDYLCLELEGKYETETDKTKKQILGESLFRLLRKRNRTTVIDAE